MIAALKHRCGAVLAVCTAAFLIGAPAASAATTIDTVAGWNGAEYVHSFGHSDTQTYGQTITAPVTSDCLSSFAFYINGPSSMNFRGEVYAWDGSKATGPNLYESPPVHTSGSGGFEQVVFNTGSICLTPGQQYVLFASTSKDAGSGDGQWGARTDDPYTGGSYVYINNSDASQWTTNWDGLNGGYAGPAADVAFTATFGVVSAASGLSIRDVSPHRGTTAGGTLVTITGGGFQAGDEVYFGDRKAQSWEYIGPGTMRAISPARGPGPVHVTVASTNGVTQFDPGDQFTYVDPITGAAAPLPVGTTGNSSKCPRVPDLKGRTFRGAGRKMARLGCDVALTIGKHPPLRKGRHRRVVGQSPGPNTATNQSVTIDFGYVD